MIEISPTDTRILIVDDEESLRLTFRMFLSREGYGPLTVASTFDEAMALVEEQEFDLVISDIVLEGASGIDLLRRLKELERRCPVVMVTGYPNINTATEAIRLGAFDYLSKPVKKNDLLRTARMALQQYTLWKEKERLLAEKDRYRQFLETIFRSVRDLIIAVDLELRVVEMNDQAVKWAEEEVPELEPGKKIDELPENIKPLFGDLKQVFDTGAHVSEHRMELRLADNRYAVFRISVAPMETRGGNFMGGVLVARDVSRLESLEQRGGYRSRFHRLVGGSVAMQTVYTLIENVGRVDTTVLITGESGTGKELVAEALHAESPRRDMPLVKVDCTAIPENLLESELFGHRKGSFTGADRDRKGRILQADGGTLFLDEIGDISPYMQLRLLRFLQERTFYPVGGDLPITVDVRVIAATNANLREKLKNGKFREDLYYRLRVVDINLPSLRNRADDLPLLAAHFLAKFSKRLNKMITGISDQSLGLLRAYQWPGNVRELEHVMERACVLCSGNTITVHDLPEEIQQNDVVFVGGGVETARSEVEGGVAEGFLDETEEERIVRILKQTDGNKAKAARLLGIDRSTLYRKITLYNIDL